MKENMEIRCNECESVLTFEYDEYKECYYVGMCEKCLEKEKDESYNRGYDEGDNNGYNGGYDDGYREGLADGERRED